MSEGLGLDRSRVFEVAQRAFTLPDLTAVPPVAKVTDPVETDTTVTYYDTIDLRLAAREITVRRTESGSDAGWELTTRDEQGSPTVVRTRLQPRSAGAPRQDGVPDELVELVRASVRERELRPVAAVRTVRLERRLLDIDGRELARVGESRSHAQRFTTGAVELSHWREVDVQRSDGEPELLDAVSDALDEAGRAPTASPVDRALGRIESPLIDLRDDHDEGTVAEVVREQLRLEVAALMDQDWAVRTGRPGSVHEMRLAARRLRCDLATWRPFLAEPLTEPLRRELRWLSAVLGRRRDAEMLDARLVGTIRGLPEDMVVGPVLARVERELDERREAASARLTVALDSGRYFGLLDGLETLVGDPPFTAHAEAPADEALARRVAHVLSRLDRALAVIDRPATTEIRADQLHEVRKAAKRAGFAAEAVEPMFGRRARRLAERMLDLQEILGEHHDSVVARQALRDIGAAAHVAGESAFTYGVLHGIEQDRGEEARDAFDAARRSIGPAKPERWVSA